MENINVIEFTYESKVPILPQRVEVGDVIAIDGASMVVLESGVISKSSHDLLRIKGCDGDGFVYYREYCTSEDNSGCIVKFMGVKNLSI